MYRFTAQQVLDAIKGTRGIIARIARNLGCTWDTAERYIKMRRITREAWHNEIETANDALFAMAIESTEWLVLNRHPSTTKDVREATGKRYGLSREDPAPTAKSSSTVIIGAHSREIKRLEGASNDELDREIAQNDDEKREEQSDDERSKDPPDIVAEGEGAT